MTFLWAGQAHIWLPFDSSWGSNRKGLSELKSWDVGVQSPVALGGPLISAWWELGEWQPVSVGMARKERAVGHPGITHLAKPPNIGFVSHSYLKQFAPLLLFPFDPEHGELNIQRVYFFPFSDLEYLRKLLRKYPREVCCHLSKRLFSFPK